MFFSSLFLTLFILLTLTLSPVSLLQLTYMRYKQLHQLPTLLFCSSLLRLSLREVSDSSSSFSCQPARLSDECSFVSRTLPAAGDPELFHLSNLQRILTSSSLLHGHGRLHQTRPKLDLDFAQLSEEWIHIQLLELIFVGCRLTKKGVTAL